MNETNELGMQMIEVIPVFGDPVDQGALEQIKNAQGYYATKVALWKFKRWVSRNNKNTWLNNM